MWELDYKGSWAQKNWCFWTVGVLRVPWTVKRSNQSILKEISPEYSLEGLMPKVKLQYFGHLMWRTDSHLKKPWCWERLKAGGEGGNRGWDGWMPSPIQWTWVWVNSRSWWWTGRPGVLQSMGLQSQTQLSNWTELTNRSRHLVVVPLIPIFLISITHLIRTTLSCLIPGVIRLSTQTPETNYLPLMYFQAQQWMLLGTGHEKKTDICLTCININSRGISISAKFGKKINIPMRIWSITIKMHSTEWATYYFESIFRKS